MAKPILSEKIPPELLSKVNPVKKRILFLSPSVTSGHEREPKKDDFESMTNTSIGSGGFGKVYKVRHKVSQNVYAIKVISKQKIIESNMCEQMKLEVRIMYSLNHEHIIKLYNHFEDDDYFYLILEYAPKSHLYEKLKAVGRFTESVAAQYMREIISAVQYLHSLNPPIIHRDIKPENILLDAKESAKLCDFGWSNFFSANRVRMTYCGTPDYLSPEMIRQEGHDQRLDIWNIGVLLFEMLTGKPPFQGSNQRELFESILKIKINYPRDFPKLARDLVGKLLKSNPKERLSLAAALDHAWFKSKPEIRPVITRKIVMDMNLPTLDQAIGEDDFETVSKVSKINREDDTRSMIPSLLTEDEGISIKANRKTEKEIMIEELYDKLEAQKKEMNDQKVQLDNTTKEAKAVKAENDDLKKHLGLSDKGYMSEDKKEVRRLNDELNKLKMINKDRDEILKELEKTKEALTESTTNNKILENEMEAVRGEKKSLEERIAELQARLASEEKKCSGFKQQMDEAKYDKERVQAELEADIHELQFRMPSKTSSQDTPGMDGTDGMILELMEHCKKSLSEIQDKARVELAFKKGQEEANAALLAERSRFNEMKAKYENDIYEYQTLVSRSVEDVQRKCEAEKDEELDQRDKQIEDLTEQLSQVEMQEGKAAIEESNMRTTQIQFVQLNKVLADLRLQVLLYSKEQNCLKESVFAKDNLIQDLKYQLEAEKQRNTEATQSTSNPQ